MIKNTRTSDDPIEPKHYSTVDGVESIKFFEASTSPEGYKGYLQLTAIKYLYRLDSKDSALVNVRKAKWFLEKLEEHLVEQEKLKKKNKKKNKNKKGKK